MDRHLLFGGLGLVLMALAAPAHAQAPFFGGGAVAFDPEVGVVSSGALLDAQATVSADRKYVTLNMQPQLSRVRSFQPFPVNAFINAGFVGGINLPAGNVARQNAPADNGRGAPVAPTPPSPDDLSRAAKAWVFTRQGMFLIHRLPQ